MDDGDYRRACVLWMHYVDHDYQGVDAIYTEAAELGRLRELVWSLPAVLASVSDAKWWHAPETARLFAEHAAQFVLREHRAGMS
ncbi:MAG: hypothetical protein QOF30_715 [Acidimicrobiaceae bacterium]|nr:hypothetical protein [Acidimicrobiaceae bacterium]